jgi:hypothetical protein
MHALWAIKKMNLESLGSRLEKPIGTGLSHGGKLLLSGLELLAY